MGVRKRLGARKGANEGESTKARKTAVPSFLVAGPSDLLNPQESRIPPESLLSSCR